MKTRIAVTDACIFIDLFDLNLIISFFNLELEVHTTSAIIFELSSEQQQVLNIYRSVNKLIIHNLQETDFLEIYLCKYPKSLSETDKSVLHIANKLDACVLSSNKIIRNCAKNKNIAYHGLIWLFDNLVESLLLQKKEAAFKLKYLISNSFIFQNNLALANEIDKRLKIWV